MKGHRAVTCKRNMFYRYLDFKSQGFWVGQRLDEKDPHVFRAYFYTTGKLSRAFRAKDWDEAVIISIRRKLRNEVNQRQIMKRDEKKLAG